VAMEGGTFPFCGQAISTFDEFKTELRKLNKNPNMYSLCAAASVLTLVTVCHERLESTGVRPVQQ